MIKDVELVKQILEELDRLEEPYFVGHIDKYKVKEIIINRLTGIPNTNMKRKRLIDANALDEEVMNFFLTITGDPHQAAVVKECKKSFRRIIDEQPTIYANDDGVWILCSKRMPEEHDSTFAIYKDTQLWSDAMFEKKSDVVNVTIEFKDGTRKVISSYTIDGKWKCQKNSVVKMKVIAWKPLPDAYKEQV